jgi:hypothetical protein
MTVQCEFINQFGDENVIKIIKPSRIHGNEADVNNGPDMNKKAFVRDEILYCCFTLNKG